MFQDHHFFIQHQQTYRFHHLSKFQQIQLHDNMHLLCHYLPVQSSRLHLSMFYDFQVISMFYVSLSWLSHSVSFGFLKQFTYWVFIYTKNNGCHREAVTAKDINPSTDTFFPSFHISGLALHFLTCELSSALKFSGFSIHLYTLSVYHMLSCSQKCYNQVSVICFHFVHYRPVYDELISSTHFSIYSS